MPSVRTNLAQLIAGWFTLLLYVIANSPAGLAMATLAGSCDRAHQVRVSAGEKGLQLTLHHGSFSGAHRHGAIARTLPLFAEPVSATDPDHVLSFGSAEMLSPKAPIAPPSLQASDQPAAAAAGEVSVPSAELAQQFGRPRPPPGEWGAIRCLRSTVLLI